MAGRRITTLDIRELIRHVRETTNDSAIQRMTGLNRRTIQRYRRWAATQDLLSGPLPALEVLQALVSSTLTAPPPPQTTSSVEPFRALVVELLNQQTETAAITQRLQERGFSGSYSAVRRFVAALNPRLPDVTVRVETPPGDEAQVDFGTAGRMLDPATGRMRTAWVFVMTLSWSRHQYVEFVWDQTVATWLLLHVRAFTFFAGVVRRVKLDNLKAAITNACLDDLQVQHAYRECAEHYGFLIDPCRPRTPQHTGKIESGVHYVTRNFLGGRTPTSLAQANADVQRWCLTTAGQRIHGTTKTPPLTRFAVEQGQLRPLPTAPYDLAIWKLATLHRDCYVVFEQAFYSAPFRLVGHPLQIRGGARDVRIYTADWVLVASHPRATAKGERRTHPDHRPPTKLPGLLLGKDPCRVRAVEIGPAATQVVETLFADPAIDRLRTVGRILALATTVGDVRLEAACARALRCDAVSHRTIKAILAQGLEAAPVPVPVAPPAQTFVRSAAELLGHLFGGAAWNYITR